MFKKIIDFLISILPSAVQVATKFQEDKRTDNLLEIIKGVEIKLDKILSQFEQNFNIILFWIRILLILQLINFVLLILILVLRGK